MSNFQAQVWLYFIGRTMQPPIFILFWIKNSLQIVVESSHPKKYLQNFPTSKNLGIKSFKPLQNIQSSPSLEIWSTPLGIQVVFYQNWEFIIFGEDRYQGVLLILFHLPAVQSAKKNWRVSKKKNITRREKEAPTGKNTAWAVLIVWNPGNGNNNISLAIIS